MKISWRKSREKLIDKNEDDEDDNDNNNRQQSEGRQKRNLSVQFSDDLRVAPSNHDAPLSDEEIENRWYQSFDYCRFKKDTILNSLNYINARRASKPFDETRNCTRGIEDMCILDPTVRKRYTAEMKHVYKVIREEQARQKKEWEQKKKTRNTNKSTFPPPFPDMEKFRSVSVCHTKGGRDRALARGNEYARAQQRSLGLGWTRASSSSMKNLFVSFRIQSAAVTAS